MCAQDAFYAQVEQKRLGIPREVPCAVQQWQGLIAINYAARARGITRHMRVQEAKSKCPELQCVHVQTIGGDSVLTCTAGRGLHALPGHKVILCPRNGQRTASLYAWHSWTVGLGWCRQE